MEVHAIKLWKDTALSMHPYGMAIIDRLNEIVDETLHQMAFLSMISK
jgi:hypothetical protein